jgi:DNA processing protein
MTAAEDIAWGAISEIRGVGPKTIWGLANYLEIESRTATWLLDNPDILRERLGSRCSENDISLAIDKAHNEISDSNRNRISVVHPLHPLFPPRLRLFRNEFPLPAILYAQGNMDLLSSLGVAVVGARNAGDLAMTVTVNLVSEMTRRGLNIVSGYAKGIDSTAHLTALNTGGTTTIVLAEGINGFSVKSELRPFFTSDNALVISQFEPNSRWSAHSAMDRNKLVCAISSAVLVIVSGPERDHEGRMSGSFDAGITALKMGIPTFVVTPSYFDDQPEGNQALIARGCFELDPSQDIEPFIRSTTPISPELALTTDESDEPRRKSDKTAQTNQLHLFAKKEQA